MTIETSVGCAWRAVYLYFGANQRARIGFDPKGATGPEVFGAVTPFVRPNTWWKRGIEFRLTVPHFRWQGLERDTSVRPLLYQWQQRVLHRLDGRFRRYAGGGRLFDPLSD